MDFPNPCQAKRCSEVNGPGCLTYLGVWVPIELRNNMNAMLEREGLNQSKWVCRLIRDSLEMIEA